ncbi:Smr/MutS family protein [Elongatibacter sediminis]|uniref:Smr/MutS family protein n=1 Tax=Elongatibacter sediminis TaxID=3119006 RepID=A0AAW9R7W6_9GAMM
MESKKKPRTDRELFREAMSDVRPLKPDNRHAAPVKRPAPTPTQRRRDEARVLEELLDPVTDPADLETGEELLFLREGSPPRLLRRLRRGYFSIEDSIDLHHMDQQTARTVLAHFLTGALRRGLGCVRIVHGKGLRSRDLPVLKLLTGRMLRKHPAVVAYASCRPADGGTGAVAVLLNGQRRGTR